MTERYRVTVDGRAFDVTVERLEAPPAELGDVPRRVETERPQSATIPKVAPRPTDLTVTAPLPGLVTVVRVNPGDRVEFGQVLLILEAMKMENEITALHAGTVETVHVQAGGTVGAGDALVTLR